MPEDNLAGARRKVKRKYINRYRDRHGRMRYYFRRGSRPQIPLPEPDSPDFLQAYQNALREVDEPLRRIVPSMTLRTRRRLNKQPPEIGVYLLVRRGELIYIGSSKNMVARVMVHQKNGRPFDRAFYISTTEGEREPLEKLLIKSLHPTQNRAGKNLRTERQ